MLALPLPKDRKIRSSVHRSPVCGPRCRPVMFFSIREEAARLPALHRQRAPIGNRHPTRAIIVKHSKRPAKRKPDHLPDNHSTPEPQPPVAFRHRDWIVPCAVAVVICAALRLVDLIHAPEKFFLVDGHRVLATHDAYAWLAGADRVNYKSCSPVAGFLRFLHTVTGFNLADIAFWLPMIMAPLVAVPLAWLGARWRLPEGTVAAGALAGAAPGFLWRTRLGYFDTDLFALFFPVLICVLLCCWLEGRLRPPWGSDRRLPPGWTLLWPLGMGLISKLYLLLYPQGSAILLAILATAGILGLLTASNGGRLLVILGLAIVVMAASGGWMGLALGGGLCLAGFLRPRYYDWITSHLLFLILAFLVIGVAVLFLSGVEKWVSEALRKLAGYGGWATRGPDDLYPAVLDTVVEAKDIDLRSGFHAIAGGWPLFAVWFCGYAALLWRRPAAWVFLPLLLLGLAALRLGERFTMYGGVVIGLGLGFGLTQILRRWLGWRRIGFVCQALVVAGFLLTTTVPLLGNRAPMTTAAPETIEALNDMRGRITPGAQFWIWWDYGYTTQYYARAGTFSDGGSVIAEYAVPLARIYASDSPAYAFQLMAYAAQKARPYRVKCAELPNYRNPFAWIFRKKAPSEVQSFLDGTADLPLPEKKPLPEQYLVLSWDSIKIAPAILQLGTWDFSGGKGDKIPFELHEEILEFDEVAGTLTARKQTVWLSGLALVTENGIENLDYGSPSGVFAVIDTQKGITVLMGERAYRSNLVQMLFGDPDDFERYFELVLDRAPDVRVYKLKL